MSITQKIVLTVAFLLLVPISLLLAYGYASTQHADYGWDIRLTGRTYTESHPRVVIDGAHHNAHTSRGKYYPFATLLRMDGCDVERGKKKFSAKSLDDTDVLVIVNASGGSKPSLMGINLPFLEEGKREAPAFSADEIKAVRAWVEKGGSLLLIADHAPFGESCAAMAEAFGVRMHRGFTVIPEETSDPMEFSRANGRLAGHPIIAGVDSLSRVGRVLTFTGQSLDGPPHAVALLALPDNAVEYVPPPGDREGRIEMREEPAGAAQGLAFDHGAGRVVVLGEAAMLTAQVIRDDHFGMNTPGCDNQQFALNIVHWLTRVI
jgi:hypothetical protein